jgi:hypothetical protein
MDCLSHISMGCNPDIFDPLIFPGACNNSPDYGPREFWSMATDWEKREAAGVSNLGQLCGRCFLDGSIDASFLFVGELDVAEIDNELSVCHILILKSERMDRFGIVPTLAANSTFHGSEKVCSM